MDKKNIVNTKAYFELFSNHIVDKKDAKKSVLIGIGSRKVLSDFRQFFNKDTQLECFEDSSLEKFCNIMPNTFYNNIIEDNFDLEQFKKDMAGKTFDCIIMNPPYDGNLHLKIINECLNHLTEDGKIVNLSPIRWLQDIVSTNKKNSDIIRFNDVFSHIEKLNKISAKEATDIFDGALFTMDLGLYVIKKSHTTGIDIWGTARDLNQKSFLRIIKKNNVQFNKLADIDRSKPFCMMKLFWGGHPERGQLHNNWIRTSYGYFVNGKNSNNYTPEEAKSNDKKSSQGNILTWPCMTLSTETEIRNFFNTDSTKFVRFIGKFVQTDANVYLEYFPYVGDATNPRTGLKGYLSEWTDDDFYSYYNLTSEEIKIIEETIQ